MSLIKCPNPLDNYFVMTEEDKVIYRQKAYEYYQTEYYEDKQEAIREVDRIFDYLILELTVKGSHSGDCTNDCWSCTKCLAEDIHFGEDSPEATWNKFKGMHYIKNAFKEVTELDDAISYLEHQYLNLSPTEPWQSDHIERWKSEIKSAIESLKKYRGEYDESNYTGGI